MPLARYGSAAVEMRSIFGDNYMCVYDAAFKAAVDAAAKLSDDEIDRLARFSGIVGLAAQLAQLRRGCEAAKSSSDDASR